LIDFFVSVGREAETQFANNGAAVEEEHVSLFTTRLAA
jgi:hypothetical protein